MKCNKRSFAVASVLFTLLLSLSTRTLNARDADRSSLFAAAHTAKQQCINSCRARYRDCQSFEANTILRVSRCVPRLQT